MTMENKEKILDKIKKLLKLQISAESLGNEGEAYAAANAVHRLLTQYNLTLGDISDDKEQELNINESDMISYRSVYGSQWKRYLLTLVATNNYCKVILRPYTQHMMIVGQEDNVAVVKSLYVYLVSSFIGLAPRRRAEFAYQLRQEGRKLTDRGKKKFLHSYFIGAVEGLMDNFESHKPTSEETGLMVCHTAAIEEYLSREPSYTGKDFKGKSLLNDLMPEGVFYGKKDGQNISLNRQIQG